LKNFNKYTNTDRLTEKEKRTKRMNFWVDQETESQKLLSVDNCATCFSFCFGI
jgi:hypothetical protein